MNLHDTLLFTLQVDPNTPAKTPMKFAGFNLVIEHPKGTIREIKNDAGEVVYHRHMRYSYGYFENTVGRDGDEVDVILGTNEKAAHVYVVHMLDFGPDEDEREDEDKVLLGFDNALQAKLAFFSMYPKEFFGGLTELPIDEFRVKMATAALPYRKKKITALALNP